jgi:O-antigen ligase
MSVSALPEPGTRRHWRDRATWMTVADVFAILAALTLPWSTTLPGIFVACWLGATA